MALLKGKGAMTGVNLIAKVYKNGRTKDGKTQYADVQVDSRDNRGPEQTNLHLRSERYTDGEGKTRYQNGAPYSVSQVDEIARAAGPNTEPIVDKDGNEVGTLYGFKGNVMPASRGTGLVVNTKSVQASEFKVDATTLDNQFVSMREARTTQAAARENQAAAVQEAEQVAQVDEPAVG
ncbi:hypothetical protein C8K30_1011011 [Promicromonospora sp. AC04]|uniref:hypothetical protein n=1 Tax=Promicromonospora sp. AC04 TaxID=2135723 RepID=UPI000D354DCA|nr:hypothetical protein [Promicromonospora sp. AC04]PUB32485.1 hypothetical protein C8K30_1011011 [Promicromonospora sp. AC04]